jgi:hypothetical protein
VEPTWIWAAAAGAALAVLAATVKIWLRRRSPAGRLRRLAEKVGSLRRPRLNTETIDLLKNLYALIHSQITAGDPTGAYQAIDLLKTTFGEGLARPDEPQNLTALITRAVRAKEPDIAAAAIDAFRPLLRHLPAADAPAAIQQLAPVAAIALKEKYNFLAAKAAEIIFSLLERTDWEKDPEIVQAALRALATTGALTLRRRDGDLFRELIARLTVVTVERPPAEVAGELAVLGGSWLHRIIQNDDLAMYELLAAYITAKADNGRWPAGVIAGMVKEWHGLAGTASLRPHSRLAPLISEQALRLALDCGDIKLWEAALAGAGQTARLAVQRHGLSESFVLILPIFEIGRELLAMELKFGSIENAHSFRQQALYLTVRESLALAEFIARQDMVMTAGDVLADLCRLWLAAGRANAKAVKRFCQLLAAYWLRAGGRRAQKTGLAAELTAPALLTDSDKQRLGFLL